MTTVNKIFNYLDRLSSLRKLVKNLHIIALNDAIRRLSLSRTGKYRNPLLIHTKNPDARIMIRDLFDLITLIQIWKEMYFFEDVNLEEEDRLILDVGAHIGLFSIFCALMNNNLKVYAYEPFPENCDFLLYNFKLNGLWNILNFYNQSLFNKERKIKLYLGNNALSHSLIPDKWNVKPDRFLSVRTTTLQSLIIKEGLRNIDFMKVNCEGCEYHIFEGPNIDYLERIKKLAVQCHNFDNKRNYKIIRALFRQLGFKTYTRHYDNEHTFLYAKQVK